VSPARLRPLFAATAIAALACSRAPEVAVPVTCAEIHPVGEPAAADAPTPPVEPGAGGGLAPALAVGPGDVLELIVMLDSVPPGPGSVRVRVDGLAEPGLVRFVLPPATATAAGMALAPPVRFQGCATVAAAGIELRAPFAPRAKAWVRVSSDRPVRVRPRVAGRRTEAPLLLNPGTSGIVGWDGT
jgi:hypothetical protein